MLFTRTARDVPERVFVIIQNNNGSAMAKDATCQMDATTAADGIKAVYVSDGQQYAFWGIVDQAIANQDFGLIQVYGYRSSSNVVRTNTDLSAGMPLTVVTGVQHLSQVGTAAATALGSIWAVAVQSSTSGTGSSSPKIFIKAL